ncbi:TIGR00297 family protein [Fodinibius roseus]|uniref:TIGR00297 family protein n=2 Tax=Fodinibius roseus TaxID=1194090 RepID=A0A1M4TF69_9BACT|nr:TIGR00297 family protein [Fodinibius roseus]
MVDMGNPVYYWGIIGGLFLSFLFSLAAFLLQRLSLDGMFAAMVAGTLIFGLGGWPMAAIILLFFISSAVISTPQDEGRPPREDSGDVRRSGIQVWANGFWMVVSLVMTAVFDSSVFLLGGVTAVAVATADTWATELRSRKEGATRLITTFEQVSSGADGGISLKGTAWASAGSMLIAAASTYFFSLTFGSFFIIFTAGFLGCVLDSYLGAIFQRDNRPIVIPLIQKEITFDNNLVNAVSTGAGAFLAIILRISTI